MHWGHPGRGKVALFCGDAAIAMLAILASLGFFRPAHVTVAGETLPAVVFTLMVLSFLYIFDLYQITRTTQRTILCRLLAVCGASIFASTSFFFIYPMAASRGNLILAVLVACAGSYVLRCLYRLSPQMFVYCEPVLIVGTIRDARTIGEVLERHDPQYKLVGYLGERPRDTRRTGSVWEPRVVNSRGGAARLQVCEVEPAVSDCCPCLGNAEPAAVRAAVNEYQPEVLVVNSSVVSPELASVLTNLRFGGLRIYNVQDFHMRLAEELPLDVITHDWLFFAAGFELLQSRIFRRLKRLTDLLLAALGLLLASPLMLLTAIAIKLESPGPVLFRQVRVGWKGMRYQLLKFRSMRQDAEKHGAQWAQADDPRVTRVGKWIRKLRIDEIPQMFNVLVGQMSFIGPRPERPEFVTQLEKLVPFYNLRHYVPPGITGWAQVKYPYGDTVEDSRRKLQFDLYYICTACPVVDVRILLRTVRTVLYLQGSR